MEYDNSILRSFQNIFLKTSLDMFSLIYYFLFLLDELFLNYIRIYCKYFYVLHYTMEKFEIVLNVSRSLLLLASTFATMLLKGIFSRKCFGNGHFGNYFHHSFNVLHVQKFECHSRKFSLTLEKLKHYEHSRAAILRSLREIHSISRKNVT